VTTLQMLATSEERTCFDAKIKTEAPGERDPGRRSEPSGRRSVVVFGRKRVPPLGPLRASGFRAARREAPSVHPVPSVDGEAG